MPGPGPSQGHRAAAGNWSQSESGRWFPGQAPTSHPRDEGTFCPSFISQVLQLLKGEQASTSKAQRGLITVFPGLGGPQMTGSQGGQSVIIRGKVALDHGKSLDVGLLHQMAGEP